MSDRPNLPLPDQLAATREEIKRLTAREEELKGQLRDHPELRTGAAWIAEIKEIETNRVDIKELRAMHKDLVDEYTFPQKVTRIELSGISEDGELVSASRMRRAAKSDDTSQ